MDSTTDAAEGTRFMKSSAPRQLLSYIAPGAPATRRPARGDEPYLRLELGFTPKWYREAAGVDFGTAWHQNPSVRRAALAAMRETLDRRFPGANIGTGEGPDLLTGVHGACTVAAIYGLPVIYAPDQWPTCAGPYLDDAAADRLEPPDLDRNPFLQQLLAQVDEIAALGESVRGYINWQGVLNNAHRLRGESLFLDLMTAPDRCRHLFDCVCETMLDAARRLHARQRAHAVEVGFFTISNCLVNLVSPEIYREQLLPFDQRLAEAFGCIGVHNCAWNANPYLDAYAEIPKVAYIDMGLESDLCRARAMFPRARRALMYTPTDLAGKPWPEIRADFERIAADYGPCDLVAADIEAGTPDDRIARVQDLCQELSARWTG